MLTPEQLREENERLKAENEAYKVAEKAHKQKWGRRKKRLSSFVSSFFLGSGLKKSIRRLVVEIRDKDRQVSDDALGDALAHGLWRFTRIGCFAIFVAVIPLALLGVQTTLLYFQNQKIDIQNELVTAQNIRLDQQTNLQEAGRRSSLVFLFSNIMDAIDRELKDSNDKQRKLSKQLIGRIIALSASLRPYRYLTEGDTLTSRLLSPERGQLLISLAESDLASVTYFDISRKANFEYADLQGADLYSANLSGAHLSGADLSGAYLGGAYLGGAYLRGVNLSGAYLRGVNLSGADLAGANFEDAKTKTLNFLTYLDQDIIGNNKFQEQYYIDSMPLYEPLDMEKKYPYYLIKPKSSQK
jgi:hypothetical protein